MCRGYIAVISDLHGQLLDKSILYVFKSDYSRGLQTHFETQQTLETAISDRRYRAGPRYTSLQSEVTTFCRRAHACAGAHGPIAELSKGSPAAPASRKLPT